MLFKTILKIPETVEIDEFEIQLGNLLPDDYKKFLLKFNGGFPEKKIFHIDDQQGEDILSVLYGIDKENKTREHLTLAYNFNFLRIDLPQNILPIGHDPGGNYICMSLSEDNYGKIYFWDHEVPNEDKNGKTNYNNMYLIAEDFNVFIDNLH